ncbi:MAG: DUF1475 family protein [Acidobacteria bacterium]|jgi:hypothetical protein|nr:DUF1475 family protein [Acidobacteriota bacterium]
MILAKAVALLGVVVMSAALFHGFANGDFFGEGRQLAAMPWGIVSLVDLYTGFVLFSGWIIYRERSVLVAVLWTIAMMTLGFFAGSLYTFIALHRSGGDWRRFWLGRHTS